MPVRHRPVERDTRIERAIGVASGSRCHALRVARIIAIAGYSGLLALEAIRIVERRGGRGTGDDGGSRRYHGQDCQPCITNILAHVSPPSNFDQLSYPILPSKTWSAR